MNNLIMQNFIQLVSTHTGLQIRAQDQKDFCNKIYLRVKSLKLNTPEQYYELLSNAVNSQNTSIDSSENEWKELLLLLTVGETYFFRDRGQFNLLKKQILPELIELKRKSCAVNGEKKPSLRIWSAGCSTGEEPYSLAILVKELIPDLSAWNILVLGTDINPESIEKAKRGIYDTWSFRQVNTQLQEQYFRQRKLRWEVDEQLRKMVKFRCSNLFQEHFPSLTSDIHSIDLIICRNVFIYFKPQAITTVLDKFYHTLIPGGYLITGHTELHGQKLGQLQPKVFSESVVYQSSTSLQVEPDLVVNSSRGNSLHEWSGTTQKNTVIKQTPAHSLTKNVALSQAPAAQRSQVIETQTEIAYQTVLHQAETLFHAGNYVSTIQLMKQIVQQYPQHFSVYYLMAQAWANLGEYEQATYWCQQALQVDNLSEKPYYLLVHIAEEKGDLEQAKTLLKKIIYLAPSFIAAYLELGSIYEREGDCNRAKKMLKTALELLKVLPQDSTVELQNQTTASELIIQVKERLRNYR